MNTLEGSLSPEAIFTGAEDWTWGGTRTLGDLHSDAEGMTALLIKDKWLQRHTGALGSCGCGCPSAWPQASFGVTKLGATAHATGTLSSQNNASEQEGSK